jgi:hypothetical protein
MTDKNFFSVKYDVLMEEWKMMSTHIGRLDDIVFTVRGWAVAGCTAAMGYSYTSKDPRACLFALIPLLMVWFIDALLKNFQRVYIIGLVRSKHILRRHILNWLSNPETWKTL